MSAIGNPQAARAAFFPTITLTGTLGWNNGSAGTVNPANLLLNTVGQLTQPIFARMSK